MTNLHFTPYFQKINLVCLRGKNVQHFYYSRIEVKNMTESIMNMSEIIKKCKREYKNKQNKKLS